MSKEITKAAALTAPGLETKLLAGILADEDRLADLKNRVTAEDFSVKDYQIIFSLMDKMFTEGGGQKIDIYSIHEQWKVDYGEGGDHRMQVLMELQLEATTGEYVLQHADWLHDLGVKRRLLAVMDDTRKKVLSGEGLGEDILSSTEDKIMDIHNQYVPNLESDMVDEVKIAFHHVMEKIAGNLPTSGLLTGFRKFDRISGGFKPGKLYVLAARPGMGKTALVANWATEIVKDLEQEAPVMFYSLEMVGQEIAERVLFSEARVSKDLLDTPEKVSLAEKEMIKRGYERVQEIGHKRYIIDVTPAMDIHELYSRARRAVLRFKVKLIVIDYIQLMRNRKSGKNTTRQYEMASISGMLKQIAKDLNVPVLVLSQLNRDIEKRDADERKPQLSDLRDTGALEQDADMVMFIHRPDAIGTKVSEQQRQGMTSASDAMLVIAKHRGGPVGEVSLKFWKGATRFEEIGEG